MCLRYSANRVDIIHYLKYNRQWVSQEIIIKLSYLFQSTEMRMFFGDFQLNQGVFLNICDFWYNPDLFFSYLTYFFLYLSVPSTLNTVINWQSITAQRLFPLLQNIMHQFSRNSRIEHFYYAYHKINEMSKYGVIWLFLQIPFHLIPVATYLKHFAWRVFDI